MTELESLKQRISELEGRFEALKKKRSNTAPRAPINLHSELRNFTVPDWCKIELKRMEEARVRNSLLKEHLKKMELELHNLLQYQLDLAVHRGNGLPRDSEIFQMKDTSDLVRIFGDKTINEAIERAKKREDRSK